MHDEFWAWYPPTAQQLGTFSSEAIVALDANVLLAPYRLPSASREALLGVLEALADRVFVPHQAALEYQRNRLGVVAEQIDHLSSLKQMLDDAKVELSSRLEKKRRNIERHPNLDYETVACWVDEAFESLANHVSGAASDLTAKGDAVAGTDVIHTRLTTLLHGRIGTALNQPELKALLDDGVERYKRGVPPGYADKSKMDERGYGDLIIWKELIHKSKAAGIPLVFITDDQKEDWVRRTGGLRAGPLPALREEFRAESDGQDFWLYNVEQFLRLSAQFTTTAVDETVISEIADHISGDPGADIEQALRDELAEREVIIGNLHASLIALAEGAEQPGEALRQLRTRLDREIDRAAEIRAAIRSTGS